MESDNKQRQLKKLIKEYLKEAKMMQLATVNNGKPWVCNVWFAVDNDLNIYWFSSTTRRHSIDVSKDPHVAAAICLPHTPSDPARGIQLEGVAEMITDPKDMAKATRYYIGRIFSVKQVKFYINSLEKPHKFYKITPNKFVLFDTVNFPDDSRQELLMR